MCRFVARNCEKNSEILDFQKIFFEEQQNEWAAGRGKKYRNVLERFTQNTIGNSDVTVSHIYICHTREFEFGAPSKVPSGRMLITEKWVRTTIIPAQTDLLGSVICICLPGEIPLFIDTFGGWKS